MRDDTEVTLKRDPKTDGPADGLRRATQMADARDDSYRSAET